jgi:hypothetical protein
MLDALSTRASTAGAALCGRCRKTARVPGSASSALAPLASVDTSLSPDSYCMTREPTSMLGVAMGGASVAERTAMPPRDGVGTCSVLDAGACDG